METQVQCLVCNMMFDSHTTITETLKLVRNHMVAKHPETLDEEYG